MSDQLIKNLSETEDLIFHPTPQQRQLKSTFWVKVNDSLPMAPSEVTLSSALQVTDDNRLKRWWKVPGFSEWFSNKDEFRQRLEYLANLALDKVEDILLTADPKAFSAQVNIIKSLMEVAGKVPARVKEVKYLDDGIQKMDRRQLEEFLKLSEGKKDESSCDGE